MNTGKKIKIYDGIHTLFDKFCHGKYQISNRNSTNPVKDDGICGNILACALPETRMIYLI